MTNEGTKLQTSAILGCVLGHALGDALGAVYEGGIIEKAVFVD